MQPQEKGIRDGTYISFLRTGRFPVDLLEYGKYAVVYFSGWLPTASLRHAWLSIYAEAVEILESR